MACKHLLGCTIGYYAFVAQSYSRSHLSNCLSPACVNSRTAAYIVMTCDIREFTKI
jgi:hypothetical protein